MKIEQIYTGCLYQASYFIESNGESAVIDPLRESDIYLDKVKKTKSKLVVDLCIIFNYKYRFSK